MVYVYPKKNTHLFRCSYRTASFSKKQKYRSTSTCVWIVALLWITLALELLHGRDSVCKTFNINVPRHDGAHINKTNHLYLCNAMFKWNKWFVERYSRYWLEYSGLRYCNLPPTHFAHICRYMYVYVCVRAMWNTYIHITKLTYTHWLALPIPLWPQLFLCVDLRRESN